MTVLTSGLLTNITYAKRTHNLSQRKPLCWHKFTYVGICLCNSSQCDKAIRLVRDQLPTSVTNQSQTGERQPVQIGGIAKTCHRTVGDWSPMGSDICAMVSDSRMISADLLPTDCDPLEIRPVLD